MNRPSTRLILAGMTAAVLGGSIAAASAETAPVSEPKKDHTICLINQDSATGPQHGLCITIPLLPPPADGVVAR